MVRRVCRHCPHLLPRERERPERGRNSRPAICSDGCVICGLCDTWVHLPGRERHNRGAADSRAPAAGPEWKQISFCLAASRAFIHMLAFTRRPSALSTLPGTWGCISVDLCSGARRCPRQYGAAISLLSSASRCTGVGRNPVARYRITIPLTFLMSAAIPLEWTALAPALCSVKVRSGRPWPEGGSCSFQDLAPLRQPPPITPSFL
ncbi:hypothetical protein GQ53DRAFT_152862 [Thozetella sp. PMI_491]|nr:hypothetical protein GQ53DRAFT_152862 [Thozetella sp. PMI_491]